MTEHTPGPWGVERQEDLCPDGNGYIWAIKAKRKSEEKNVNGGWKHYVQNPAYANSEANARLIAAAPELLAALEESVAELCLSINFNDATDLNAGEEPDGDPDTIAIVGRAEAAIAKATS